MSYYWKQLGRLGVYGVFIGVISVTLYPIVIHPMMNVEYYSKYLAQLATHFFGFL